MSGPGLNVPANDPRMPALRQVRPPAFLMLCIGILNVLFYPVLLGLEAINALPPEISLRRALLESPTLTPLTLLAAVVSGALSVWGALSAMSLRNWGLVVVGAVVTLLPLYPTCCLGVLVGGWMLWAANMPMVKKHFE